MGSIVEVADNALLIARAGRGDAKAMEALYRAYEGPVLRLARHLCDSEADAEEVLQETFMEVFRSLSKFRGDSSFGTWLRTVASSKALMRIRKRRSRPEEPFPGDDETGAGGGPASPGWGEVRPEDMDVRRAFLTLPPVTRAVIWLHDVEGCTHEEIARALGGTVSFSKSRLSRGHERLREALSAQAAG
jgi:RNA polymerase sigma-70 factor (ECF subfamily)